MEASKTSSHFLRVEAYNRGEQKPNKTDDRVDVFVNGKCILGAPIWDLPSEYPFVSTYRLDNTYSMTVKILSEGKIFSRSVVSLDQSALIKVECYTPTLMMLSITSPKGALLYPGVQIPKQASSTHPL
ncbi:MAG: hypothetical protein KFB95_02755 [Simkaniaceae bacterium]|nr:MAG: hypothetical protein KFB95_02755 [Simkaniaceae bacterium]